jgi:hypothetical protein
VIALPPFDGAVQLTLAEPLPAVEATFVGAAGAVGDTGAVGVTELDGLELGLVPTAFVAVTRKVYAVPLVRPGIVTPVDGGDPVTSVEGCAVVPINGVTVYLVRALPPFAGTVQLTVAEALPAVADTFVGAAGAVGVDCCPSEYTTSTQ